MNDLRSALSSDDRDNPPGPLAGVKRGATSDPGYPQPQAAEVESARLLANDSRQTLRAAGFSDRDIDQLADDFIAEDRGEETEAFMDWARRVRRAAARPQPSSAPPGRSGPPGRGDGPAHPGPGVEAAELRAELERLVAAIAPWLVELPGVGPSSAAQVPGELVARWPGALRSRVRRPGRATTARAACLVPYCPACCARPSPTWSAARSPSNWPPWVVGW